MCSVIEAKSTENVCRACCTVSTYGVVHVNDFSDGTLILGNFGPGRAGLADLQRLINA